MTIIMDLGAEVSAMPKGLFPNVPKSGRLETKFHRVGNGLFKKIAFKTKNGSTQSMDFRVADEQGFGISEQKRPEKEQGCV